VSNTDGQIPQGADFDLLRLENEYFRGDYVDHKAIRPDEFVRFSYAEIRQLVSDKP
jgi:hypothetical protein